MSENKSFIVDECEFHPLAKISHSKLYKAYQNWCVENNVVCEFTSTKFSMNLFKSPKLRKTRNQFGVVWLGIKLKNEPLEEEMKEM